MGWGIGGLQGWGAAIGFRLLATILAQHAWEDQPQPKEGCAGQNCVNTHLRLVVHLFVSRGHRLGHAPRRFILCFTLCRLDVSALFLRC